MHVTLYDNMTISYGIILSLRKFIGMRASELRSFIYLPCSKVNMFDRTSNILSLYKEYLSSGRCRLKMINKGKRAVLTRFK